MQFLKTHRGRHQFQIGAKEKQLLFKILRLYPVIPANHQRLSKSEDKPDDQELLDAALAEQRAENRKQLLVMLKAKSRFRKNQHGYRFSIPAVHSEWLLQVLNDVRVGSWLALGSPDGHAAILATLSGTTARHFWAMEISGHFQMGFLQAMTGGGPKSGGK